ncbi:MAG: HAMP domain-containing sensor histidine kinase [Nostocoides sp.]
MRQQLLRSTLLAVGVALVVVSVPALALVVFIGTRSPAERQGVVDHTMTGGAVAAMVAVPVVLAAVALGAGAWIAWRLAARFSEPIIALADRAERLGAGESRFQPLDSGIPEVDRVSDVLSDSARSLTTSLAAERDFASDASHQLRTPLTALLMRLDEVATTDDLDVVREEAGIAIAQVERLTKVVDDLLARSRRHEQAPSTVSLDSVIAALQREWQVAFEKARRSVLVSGERGLFVSATPVALSQVLSTLLENSLAHGRGTVEVAARRSGPSVIVEVSDQGEGVPATLAPHIFQRSVSTTGSGLGLALARDLAEANGGRLELVSAERALFALFLSEASR